MFMAPIEPSPRRHDYVVVRLMRRWVATNGSGEPQLPALVKLGRRLGLEPQAALAIASMFQLTEACLGRPLEAECCCNPHLSPDEQAILTMLSIALPAGPHQACQSVPHGLPGALMWAVASVRRLVGETHAMARPMAGCPFGRAC